jgi:hypothetical protein
MPTTPKRHVIVTSTIPAAHPGSGASGCQPDGSGRRGSNPGYVAAEKGDRPIDLVRPWCPVQEPVGHAGGDADLGGSLRYHGVLLTVWAVVVLALITQRFWSFWMLGSPMNLRRSVRGLIAAEPS